MEDSTMTDIDMDIDTAPVPVHADPSSSTLTLRHANDNDNDTDPNKEKEVAKVWQPRARAERRKKRRVRIAEAKVWVEQRREEKRVAGMLEGFGLAEGKGKGKGKEREEGEVEDEEEEEDVEKAVSSADGGGKRVAKADPLHSQSLNDYIQLHGPPQSFVSALERSFLPEEAPPTKEFRQERARALQLEAQTAAAARRGQTLDEYLACKEHTKARRKQALVKREKARGGKEARGGDADEEEEWRLAPSERYTVPRFGAGLPGLGTVDFGAGMGRGGV